jgi:phage-related protein
MYRVAPDAIVILEVFAKKARTTPQAVIDTCKERMNEYENAGK